MKRSPLPTFKWWLLIVVPALMAGLGWIVARVRPARPPSAYALALSVHHPDGHEQRVLPGSSLSPGDLLRFHLSAERPGYLTLIGVDAAHQVTRHLPQREEPVSIPAGREQPLEGSVRLGAALGPERFIALVCDTPMPEAQVRGAAERALSDARGNPARMGRLELPCQQAHFLIQNVTPL